jgi:hypothetical protein
MSDLKHLVHTGIKITIASINDVLREYKITLPKDQYQVGFNEGIAEAMKAIQLFQKKLEEQEQRLDD